MPNQEVKNAYEAIRLANTLIQWRIQGHDINCDWQSKFADANKGCPQCEFDDWLIHPAVVEALKEQPSADRSTHA